MSKLPSFEKRMKLPGTVYLALKIYFLSLVFLTINSIQQFKVKKINFVTIAKKISSNEHTLLNRIKDAINGEKTEKASSYFDISDFNKSFPKSQLNETNFFHINIPSLCHNLTLCYILF